MKAGPAVLIAHFLFHTFFVVIIRGVKLKSQCDFTPKETHTQEEFCEALTQITNDVLSHCKDWPWG